MKNIALALVLLLAALPSLASRTINSLPWSESFNADNYRDLVWITQQATHTFLPNGGFNGSGAAKFTGPLAEGYSGIGQVILSENVRPTQMNVRFLIYHGRTWGAQSGGGKLLIMNRDNKPRARPMLIYGEWRQGGWMTLGPCDGTVCRYQAGDYWTDGSDSFRVGDGSTGRSHEWICIEMEANTAGNGSITLYIDTQDGRLRDRYISRPMDDTGGGGVWRYIDIIGGYMNRGPSRQDAENYFILDELAVSTSRIGPPAGFRGGTQPLPAPVLTIR